MSVEPHMDSAARAFSEVLSRPHPEDRWVVTVQPQAVDAGGGLAPAGRVAQAGPGRDDTSPRSLSAIASLRASSRRAIWRATLWAVPALCDEPGAKRDIAALDFGITSGSLREDATKRKKPA